MIRVTALSNGHLALAFIDYMKIESVDMELRSQGRYAELWLAQDEKLEQVEAALEVFFCSATSPIPGRQLAHWFVTLPRRAGVWTARLASGAASARRALNAGV